MKHVLENEKLTIFLEGELNSFTSEDVEREIDEILKSNKFNAVVIDLKDVKYVSSAGIRIMIRIRRQCEDTSLVNVPKNIFDVFEMVGLPNLINIQKL